MEAHPKDMAILKPALWGVQKPSFAQAVGDFGRGLIVILL